MSTLLIQRIDRIEYLTWDEFDERTDNFNVIL